MNTSSNMTTGKICYWVLSPSGGGLCTRMMDNSCGRWFKAGVGLGLIIGAGFTYFIIKNKNRSNKNDCHIFTVQPESEAFPKNETVNKSETTTETTQNATSETGSQTEVKEEDSKTVQDCHIFTVQSESEVSSQSESVSKSEITTETAQNATSETGTQTEVREENLETVQDSIEIKPSEVSSETADQSTSISMIKETPRKRSKSASSPRRGIRYDPLPLPELFENYDPNSRQKALETLYDKLIGIFLQCKKEEFCYWFGGHPDKNSDIMLPKRIKWKQSMHSLEYLIRKLYTTKGKRMPRGSWEKVANIFMLNSAVINEGVLGKNVNKVPKEDRKKIDALLSALKKELTLTPSDVNS